MAARTEPPAERPARRKKLSYLDQIEWDQMEERILEAEAELETHRRELEDPAVASNAARVHELYGQLQAVQKRVDELYARWAELEAKLSPE
jgi:ATP-binding cassette subfamily F protein uup